jgi:hypothetical protein
VTETLTGKQFQDYVQEDKAAVIKPRGESSYT